MNKQCLNFSWRPARSKPDRAWLPEEQSLWDLAGVRSRQPDEPLGEMQLLQRYDPVETQKMLDMAG
jgi:hypothetical protein